MVRLKHPWLTLLVLAGAAFLAYGAWYSWGPRRTPPGQPPLRPLAPSSISGFEAQFNAQADHPRLLLLLSPT